MGQANRRRRRFRERLIAALLAPIAMWAAPATAQTRGEEIARRQDDKARTASPDKPNRDELFLEQVEEGKWFVGEPRGWYPVFGSVYPGGGLAPGAGYRHHIGYDSYVDASAMYSLTNYKKAQVAARTPNHIRGRLDLAGSLSWLDATRVPFYGLGNDSVAAGRTTFRINRMQMEGSSVLHLVDWLRL